MSLGCVDSQRQNLSRLSPKLAPAHRHRHKQTFSRQSSHSVSNESSSRHSLGLGGAANGKSPQLSLLMDGASTVQGLLNMTLLWLLWLLPLPLTRHARSLLARLFQRPSWLRQFAVII